MQSNPTPTPNPNPNPTTTITKNLQFAISMEKVKLMCSYGGKIHHRPHDRQLSYVGGDTKILTIDRTIINFSNLLSKLNALCDYNYEIRFKYKLPGQDLDALISVFDDDDVENMMFEYDLLRRISAAPPRLRLFVFFQTTPVTTARSVNPDFLFGFDKEYSLNYTAVVKISEDKDTTVSPPENVGIGDGVRKQIQEIPSPVPVPVPDNRTMTHGSYVFPTPFVYRAPMPSSGYFQAGEYRGVGNREQPVVQPVVYSFIPGGNREQPVGYGFIPVGGQEQPNIPMSGSPLSHDAARGESQLPTVIIGATYNHESKVGSGPQLDA